MRKGTLQHLTNLHWNAATQATLHPQVTHHSCRPFFLTRRAWGTLTCRNPKRRPALFTLRNSTLRWSTLVVEHKPNKYRACTIYILSVSMRKQSTSVEADSFIGMVLACCGHKACTVSHSQGTRTVGTQSGLPSVALNARDQERGKTSHEATAQNASGRSFHFHCKNSREGRKHLVH